jgi:WD40 repeat protein
MRQFQLKIATVMLTGVYFAASVSMARADITPPVPISADNVKRFDWVPGSNELAVMPFLGEIELFNSRKLESTRKFAVGKRLVHFAFSPDGKYLAWSENNGSFTIENLKTGKRESFEAGRDQPGLAFSPDGKWLAAGGYGTKVGLWEVATGKSIRDFATDAEGGLTPVFSPDGKILVVGNRNSNPRLFEASTGELLHVLPKKMTQRIRFNPAGTILATANVDGTVSLWDVAAGNLVREEKTTGKECYVVEWSPRGDLLVTTGLKSKMIIWDAKELRPIKEIESPEWVICARFSPDGSRLFTGGGTIKKSPDRKITIWGVDNPKP